MIIKEDYVSFEVAKLLKEKGFHISSTNFRDWLCCMYDESGNIQWGCYHPDWYARVTLQMAMKWLREEKNIFIVIEPHSYDYLNEKTSSYVFAIWEGDNYMEVYSYKNSELRGISYLTYEEAVEAALKYVLEKLI